MTVPNVDSVAFIFRFVRRRDFRNRRKIIGYSVDANFCFYFELLLTVCPFLMFK